MKTFQISFQLENWNIFWDFIWQAASEMNGEEFFLRISSPAEEIYLLFDFKRRNKITSQSREEAVPIS